MNTQLIYTALRAIQYPESDKNIVFLEMIQDLKLDGTTISFTLIIPKSGEHLANDLKNNCINVIKESAGSVFDVNIQVQFKNDMLGGIKNIVAIASGKGGVGKSTVSSNLAVALSLNGYKVGLIDADIFGPSIPKMFGCEDAQPVVRKEDAEDVIEPIEKFGVKLLSIGFFVDQSDALVWRGPMASNALKQLIIQADWGELDYLLIDLPPGTSDIHLTLVQTVSLTAAVIVSTPQQVALADVIKGVNMFKGDKINVPVVGLVENMAWFTPDELPDNKYYIFGKEGCKQLAKETGIPLIGEIPIVQGVCEDGDGGNPTALKQDSTVGQAFNKLSENFVEVIQKRNSNFAPTEIVTVSHK